MARTRAKDHDEKRDAILHRAAMVFARDGYDRASMATLASECGVSKALLYHYYASKEALLFDMIQNHLAALVEAVEEADDATLPPEDRLELLVAALLEAYRDADAEHKVQLTTLALLPDDQQEQLKTLERRLVVLFAEAVRAVDPEAFEGRALLKPVTMSLFGMLNWVYMWFRDGGPVSRDEYARLATRLLVGGLRSLPR
ncbi:TetR/AcrR family transcriptional regulator [Mesorhizobium sp. CAU 1741]|uniref:TetR/AcrR family transcriptional regulator n=1 Tax=Mesorhizobium sp. CAU 1741 TaxID=3140366 RepID=UPI00325BBCE1